MNEIALFSPSRNDTEKRLMATLERRVPRGSLKTYRDPDSLRRRLLPGGSSAPTLVILAATKQDLLAVVPLREMLLGFRVIMVLPDSDDLTLAMGWGMWPRFVSYADGDFQDVAGVLSKIVGTATHQTKGASRRWLSLK
ncbi:MAG TPA: hypothetical protein VKF36_25145 [Syntrophorhabdales bacterium]|nr:hypothetical protein [Syntrophorhabdales bacterium]